MNEHVNTGVYQIVAQEVEREKILGRLNGVSDIEAYKQIGDKINDRGGFAHLQGAQPKPAVKSQPNNVIAKKADPNLSKKRKAASSTRGKVSKPSNEDYNPLSMSDEEFEKMSSGKFN